MIRQWITTRYILPKENQKIYYFGKEIGIFRGEYFYDSSSISNPHKFYSEYGIVDADDVSYWMPYDHGLKDMIPLPPDYKKTDNKTDQYYQDRYSETVEIPEEHRQLVFSYEIIGDINE